MGYDPNVFAQSYPGTVHPLPCLRQEKIKQQLFLVSDLFAKSYSTQP